MVRYILDDEIRNIWSAPYGENGEKVPLPMVRNRFVDILEIRDLEKKIRVFIDDGRIFVGWIANALVYAVKIHNVDELFDGRFNSNKVE